MKVPRRMARRDVVRLLHETGFQLSRTKGSHEQWHHVDGRRVTLTARRGHTKDVGGRTLETIYRQIFKVGV